LAGVFWRHRVVCTGGRRPATVPVATKQAAGQRSKPLALGHGGTRPNAQLARVSGSGGSITVNPPLPPKQVPPRSLYCTTASRFHWVLSNPRSFRHEANACSATTQLTQLGGDYGKFDREGKKLFIERMETLMDRYGCHETLRALEDFLRPSSPWSSCAPSSGQFGMDTRADVQQMNQTWSVDESGRGG